MFNADKNIPWNPGDIHVRIQMIVDGRYILHTFSNDVNRHISGRWREPTKDLQWLPSDFDKIPELIGHGMKKTAELDKIEPPGTRELNQTGITLGHQERSSGQWHRYYGDDKLLKAGSWRLIDPHRKRTY